MLNTVCSKPRLHLSECDDCSKLEWRVDVLEECCKEVNAELDQKVDKEEGKGLSERNFTDADAAKLASVQAGAEANVQSDWNETDQYSDAYIRNKPDSLGGDKYFVYDQSVPASTWTITHNLNKHPSVAVVDSAGTVVIGDCQYINDNELVLTFTGAFSGKAYLN